MTLRGRTMALAGGLVLMAAIGAGADAQNRLRTGGSTLGSPPPAPPPPTPPSGDADAAAAPAPTGDYPACTAAVSDHCTQHEGRPHRRHRQTRR